MTKGPVLRARSADPGGVTDGCGVGGRKSQTPISQQASSTRFRDPLSLEDYFTARVISTPFGLYDCDVPADGSVAVVVSVIETTPDLDTTPVMVEALGTKVLKRLSRDQDTLDELSRYYKSKAAQWVWGRLLRGHRRAVHSQVAESIAVTSCQTAKRSVISARHSGAESLCLRGRKCGEIPEKADRNRCACPAI